jgi:phosphoribosylaminoimidazolecarboxamide formyltransferase/IMP cyclohydrolase
MAPGFTAEALEVFKTKVNVRILQIACHRVGKTAWDNGRNRWTSSAWARAC